jgi:hypothetical protein
MCLVRLFRGQHTRKWSPEELTIVLFQTPPDADVVVQVFGELNQDQGDSLPVVFRQL